MEVWAVTHLLGSCSEWVTPEPIFFALLAKGSFWHWNRLWGRRWKSVHAPGKILPTGGRFQSTWNSSLQPQLMSEVALGQKRHAVLVIPCYITNYPVMNHGCNNTHHMCVMSLFPCVRNLGVGQRNLLPQGLLQDRRHLSTGPEGHASWLTCSWAGCSSSWVVGLRSSVPLWLLTRGLHGLLVVWACLLEFFTT